LVTTLWSRRRPLLIPQWRRLVEPGPPTGYLNRAHSGSTPGGGASTL
jgi:hypothetical protein